MARIKHWPGGFIDPRSGIYYILREIAGVRYKHSTRCRTLEGAIAQLERFERDPANFVPGSGPQPDKHEFGPAVENWLRFSRDVKGNGDKHVTAQAYYFGTWAKFLEQRGVTFLQDITPALVDDFIAWRRSGAATGRVVGPHAIALEVAAMKVLFSWAARPAHQGGFLPANPLERYKLPKRPKASSRVKVFSMEWWTKVRPHLTERWQLVGDVLLGSAMRYSSLSRLTVDDVDLERDTIHLRGNAIKGKEGVTLYVSHRVAMAARQVAMLGVPKDSGDFDKALERARLTAGVEHHSAHDFRHSAASMAIDDGVKGRELQQRLAHASFATTERYIARLGHNPNAYRGRL